MKILELDMTTISSRSLTNLGDEDYNSEVDELSEAIEKISLPSGVGLASCDVETSLVKGKIERNLPCFKCRVKAVTKTLACSNKTLCKSCCIKIGNCTYRMHKSDLYFLFSYIV